MQICRGFTDAQWNELRKRLSQDESVGDEGAWRCAFDVFERRIRERFLSCVEALQRNDPKLDIAVSADAAADCSTLPADSRSDVVVPGFAIMALCCLLIETLQAFREAQQSTPVTGPCTYPHGRCIPPEPSTIDAFRKFLQLPSFRGEFADDKVVRSFVTGVRNGIFHEAETRRWAVWREEPKDRIIEPEARGYAVNRTAFYEAVKAEFYNYLDDIRNPSNTTLRGRFIKKMDDIAKEC
jgi:hypothetical protein